MSAPRTITEEVVVKARRLIDGGHSQRQAAAVLGISQGGLSARLREKFGDMPDRDPSAQISEDYTEIPVIHRDYSHLDELLVYPLGDVHKGSPAHDSKKWQQWIDYLAERDNTSFLGTGDFLNSAIKGSVSETYDEEGPVGEMKRSLYVDLLPLKERIDLLMPGNHEARVYRAVGDCPIRDVAFYLDAPYAQNAALVVYKVGEVEYQVYVRHGTGGGQVGARATRLQKQAQTVLADAYVSGHTHSQLSFPEEIFQYEPEADRIVRKTRYFISSGSFLRYEGYAAGMSYAPTRIGAPRITLDGRARDIRVSI